MSTGRKWSRRAVLTAGAGLAGLASGVPVVRSLERLDGRMLRGVNLAGAEFGSAMPGTFGTDYTYPEPSSFGRFAALGFNCIRLPFRWERLQPIVDGPFDEPEWQRIAGIIDAASVSRQTLVLDMHNSAHRKVRDDGWRTEQIIGSSAVPTAAFARTWVEITRRVAGRSHVVLGIMNEPANIAVEVWRDIAQAVIDAIRKAGNEHLILLPGVDWSGAHSWFSQRNTLIETVRDPARHMAIEVHQYVDSDSSGRSGAAQSATIGSERLEAFQEWARERRLKAFLGEFGSGSAPSSLAAIEDMVREVESNPDVWIGWTAWAAGPWWPPDEPLRLEPDANGTLPPQTASLTRFTRPSTEPSGRIAGSIIDLDLARHRAYGVDATSAVLATNRSVPALARRKDGRLVDVGAGELAITDLGLILAAAAEGPSPPALAQTSARDSASLTRSSIGPPHSRFAVWALRARDQEVRFAPAVPTGTISTDASARSGLGLRVHWNPLHTGTLHLTAGACRASIDLQRWTARMVAGNGDIDISTSGGWRAIRLLVPARELAAAPISLRLEAPDAATLAFCDLTAPPQGPPEAISLTGALHAHVRQPDVCLLLETREHIPSGGFLWVDDRPLLRLRDSGDGTAVLDCPHAVHAITSAVAVARFRERRRILLGIARSRRKLLIAATGAAPVSVDLAMPQFPRDAPLRIGVAPPGLVYSSLVVTRIAVLPVATTPAEAAAIVG